MKRINNKKKIILFFLLLTIISTLPIFLIKGLPYGGDLNFHLKRIEAITINIKNGKFGYPIYFNYLNNYGYASGLFYPDLFLYIPALLNIIGFSLFTSYKIFIFIIKLLSLVSIYYSVKAINKSEKSGIIAIILYAFSSYCYIDMFERGALAETITIIFVPLVIRGLYEIVYGDIKKYYFLPIGLLGILFSHVISMYIISIFTIIFVLVNIKHLTKEKIKKLLKSAIIVLLIGSHFIIPLLEQMLDGKFYYSNISKNNILLYNSVLLYRTFLEIPYYAFINDLYQVNDWTPCGIGIIYLYLIIYYFKHKEKFDNISKSFLYSGIICLIFSTSIFWYIPIMTKVFSIIQFSFRIYILATVLLIICLSRVFSNIKKIFIFSLIMFSINLFYPFINIKLSQLTSNEISYGEYLPINYPYIEYSNDNEDKIISNCPIEYTINHDLITKIEYKTKCENITLELPIIYYKGYNVKLNNEDISINRSDNGLIELNTNIKQGNIEIYYKGTSLYNITKYISIISLLGGVINYVKKK